MVELALVMIPLMMMLYGLIAFGMVIALKQSMTSAAADAARSAVGAPVGTEASVAQATVAQRLSWMGSKIQPSDTIATVVDCTTIAPDASGHCMQVIITYPYSSRPVVPQAPGLGLVTPSQLTAKAVVKFS
jgi:Flp pilus assembly protein TadG